MALSQAYSCHSALRQIFKCAGMCAISLAYL
mgnify:CR=1 FL=1